MDIAVEYYKDIDAIYTDTTDDGADVTAPPTYGYTGWLERYTFPSSGTVTSGAKFQYDAAAVEYTAETDAYTLAESNYATRSVLIATAAADYELAQADWESNNALINKLTALHRIAEAVSDADEAAMDDAEDAW